MIDSTHQQSQHYEAALASFCQVCFVPFNKKIPRKLDDGSQVLLCIKCKCRTHKSCYDLEANSTFISAKLREFICQRCEKKELQSKACIICHRKQGVMKKIQEGQVIHIFCGLTHKDIDVISYYPEIKLKKSPNYKETSDKCLLCKKPNAGDQCAMESCNKKVHGYCAMVTFKEREEIEDDPQCWKYYFGNGDNGVFDLSHEIVSYDWVSEEFERILRKFEEHGFALQSKEELKIAAYEKYRQREMQERTGKQIRRGGFAYVLCNEHESSMYCNCLNRGSGDMVLCESCFEWYHQKCVNYHPKKENEDFVCVYCSMFYDLKKKIIEEVRNSKIENYEIKFDPPKLWLMDFIWLLRVIDHRIAGGASAKMLKQLLKYPLKTSKMEIIVKTQNKKKISELTEEFIVSYLSCEEHRKLVVPRAVMDVNEDQKPIILEENVEFNKKLKDYMKDIESFSKTNHLPDFFKPVMTALRFKEKALDEDYNVITELLKTDKGYPEIAALKIKAEAYSFMEVLKDINTGSMIKFEDLEVAVEKAKQTENIPNYLLKSLIERYEKVKSLVELVTKNIEEYRESSTPTEAAVKKLKEELIYPPAIYERFVFERRVIKELYLLYLKEEGKGIGEALDTNEKIEMLHEKEACNPNREIGELINSMQMPTEFVNPKFPSVIEKYLKPNIIFELKQHLSRKSIPLSALVSLSRKYQALNIESNDTQVKELMDNTKQFIELWESTITRLNPILSSLYDVFGISTEIKHIQEIIEKLINLPLSITDHQENVPGIGSLSSLYHLKQSLDTLMVLCTESSLAKNPLTITKLPHNLPKENPLVKNYLLLKKEHSNLQNKFISFYARIHERIENFRNDPNKQRKEQLKENLQKPNLNEISDFIEILHQSKLNMESQIKQLTDSVNQSLQIAKKAKEFLATKCFENIKTNQQLQVIKKQIDELRKKILIEAHLSLQNELTELYHAQICVRMQKMIISGSPQLQKMNKLLKFAEQEGLTHLPTYQHLKAKFQVNHESTKQTNQIKKHETLLTNEAKKDNSFMYSSLAGLRRSLHLMRPKDCNQKNSHVQALLERNTFLRRKIQFILQKQPKKYDIEEGRSVYFQALKNPFDVFGLSKLEIQLEKAEKITRKWKESQENESSISSIFSDYELLIFVIDDIESARKNIEECEGAGKRMELLRHMKLNIQGLEEVQDVMQNLQTSSISKSSDLYFQAKIKYFEFWIAFLKAAQQEKKEVIPYSKVKSVLIECYFTIQKLYRKHMRTHEYKEIVHYLESLLLKIKNTFKYGHPSETFEGFIDLEDLKFQIESGLSIEDEIHLLKPFEDPHRFTYAPINKYNETVKRQRTEDQQMQDPYRHEEKHSKIKLQLSEDEEASEKEVDSHLVTETQRQKIKEILLKNISKNKELMTVDNISEQVGLIENQIFGTYHSDIVKYLEMSDSFEKLFIKLTNLPNLSTKVAKKKFEWSFLKLLVENIHKFADLEKRLAEKNKDQEQNEVDKPFQPPKVEEVSKSKNIEDMIATGQLDESIRRDMKKQLKAIKDKKKKKRNKESSRSPQAHFSSQSEDNKLPSYIQKEYNEPKRQFSMKNQTTEGEKEGALMFDPQSESEQKEEKRYFDKGTILRLKNVNIELVLKKKGKVATKGYMVSDEDQKKILTELVDPGFSLVPIKKQKSEHQIINYLNKPSRNKYKFLVGWLESSEDSGNEALRDLAIECTDKKRIYGIQNERIKMHIMSIRQYIKISKFHEPCGRVSSASAQNSLQLDRMIFVLQYPSQKMYELKGTYQNFTDIQPIQESYPVEIPQYQPKMQYGSEDMSHAPYMMNYNPVMYPPQPMQMPEEEIKPATVIEGWGAEETVQIPVQNKSFVEYPSMNINSILSRFSPILSEEENNDEKIQEEKTEKQEVDLASNILNSLNEVSLKADQPQNFSNENTEQQRYESYPASRYSGNVPNQWGSSSSSTSYPPQIQPRISMPYNPMASHKYPPPPPQGISMMYKNPMMQNRGYHPQQPQPQMHPPGMHGQGNHPIPQQYPPHQQPHMQHQAQGQQQHHQSQQQHHQSQHQPHQQYQQQKYDHYGHHR